MWKTTEHLINPWIKSICWIINAALSFQTSPLCLVAEIKTKYFYSFVPNFLSFPDTSLYLVFIGEMCVASEIKVLFLKKEFLSAILFESLTFKKTFHRIKAECSMNTNNTRHCRCLMLAQWKICFLMCSLGSRQHDAERPQRNWIQGSSDLLVIPTDYIKTN